MNGLDRKIGRSIPQIGLIGLITGGATVVAVRAWGMLVKIGAVIPAPIPANRVRCNQEGERCGRCSAWYLNRRFGSKAITLTVSEAGA